MVEQQDLNNSIDKSIIMQSGEIATIIGLVEEGKSSIDYKVNYNKKEMLCKLYKKDFLTSSNLNKLYRKLFELIENGKPSEIFLWPEDITKNQDEYIAYIIPYKPDHYSPFTDFLKGKVHFSNFSSVVNAAINVINCFKDIHNRQYSLLLDNEKLYFSPDTGDTLLCFEDYFFPFESTIGLTNKQRWLAPELVTGEIERPNIESDLFLLSLILFRMLFINHPLEGRNTTVPLITKDAEIRFFGEDPIYILDPEDNRNRPVPGTDHNLRFFVPLYPKYLLEMFSYAFSKDVLHQKKERISEDDWLDTFLRAKKDLGKCQFCDSELFFPESRKTRCFHCGKNTEMNPQ